MTRRQLCRGLAALSMAGMARSAFPAETATPNVVLIMTDDQGWWDIGVHGNRDIETPVMDRLMTEGVEFTRFYACPVCSPTRASLMSGCYYPRSGAYNNNDGAVLPPLDVTLGGAFQNKGYRTGMFGKWHLGKHNGYLPGDRGFDETVTFVDGSTERYYYPDKLRLNNEPIHCRGYITDILTDAAITFIRSNRSRPFFAYVPYNAPHSPRLADNEVTERFLKKGVNLEDAQTYAMIARIDENIDRILAALDEEGLSENTLVIFQSDNGGLTQHYNAGLRGLKGSVYEGGVRVPFVARWPGRFPAGAKVDAMASMIDVLPTFCDLIGYQPPKQVKLDGKSLLSLMRDGGGESPHEYLFNTWDSWHPQNSSPIAVTGHRYKLVGEELFDILNDRGETKNIASKHPEIVSKLRAKRDEWLEYISAENDFQPTPIQVGREDENPVEIQAGEAMIDGTRTVTFYRHDTSYRNRKPEPVNGSGPDAGPINITWAGYSWDSIDGWRNPGETASWKLDVVAAGKYEVTISYGCDPADAGGTYRLSLGDSHLDGTVSPTISRHVFKTEKLGSIRVSKGLIDLKVSVVETKGKELMALNRIWLRKLP